MSHINALVNINGIPYLLGEYLDHNSWQQLNEYDVTNDIVVDTSEPMRAIIDVSLRDIPTNQDGTLYLVGNSTLQSVLLKKINRFYNEYCGKLDTIRSYLKIKVNYQLEDARTGHIIRTTMEEFRLNQRNLFVKINTNNTNNNPILSNYSNTIVSNITQFTHGRERMLLRITNIQLCYECIKPNILSPRVNSMRNYVNPVEFNPYTNNDYEMYEYHRRMQNSQLFPENGLNRQGPDITPFTPPRWSMNSMFYHFENNYHNLVLHENEIYDKKLRVVEVPCGVINVNRSFYINPGHQLIFKFSIWKNDLTVFNDPYMIAHSLHICNTEYNCDNHYHEHDHHDSYHHDDKNNLLYKMLKDRKDMDSKQNDAINKLNNMIVNSIYPILKKLNTDSETDVEVPDSVPTLPTENESTDNQHHHDHHNHKKHIAELYKTIEDILKEIEELKQSSSDDSTPYEEITDGIIDDIINNANNITNPFGG